MTPNRGNQYFPFPLLEEKPQQQSNNSMYRFQTFQQASSFTRPVSSQASLQPEYNQKSSDDYAEQLSYYVDGSPHLEQTKSISEDANHGSGKWVSSKMRFMRKLRNIRSNAQQQAQGDSRTNGNSRCSNINFNDTIVIRVCSDCNTTKTPLWRGGPQGPKSLCNACGIRQRKARKAMAAEALDITTTNKDKQITSKICNDHQLCSESPHKKRCSSTSSTSTTSTSKFFSSESNDDLSINLNRSSDVKEAARLLMALSSDIICG